MTYVFITWMDFDWPTTNLNMAYSINYCDKIQMNELLTWLKSFNWAWNRPILILRQLTNMETMGLFFLEKSEPTNGANISSGCFKSSQIWNRQCGVNVLFLRLCWFLFLLAQNAVRFISVENGSSEPIIAVCRIYIRLFQLKRQPNWNFMLRRLRKAPRKRCQPIQINDRNFCIFAYVAIWNCHAKTYTQRHRRTEQENETCKIK